MPSPHPGSLLVFPFSDPDGDKPVEQHLIFNQQDHFNHVFTVKYHLKYRLVCVKCPATELCAESAVSHLPLSSAQLH